jgi:hypothetical protein
MGTAGIAISATSAPAAATTQKLVSENHSDTLAKLVRRHDAIRNLSGTGPRHPREPLTRAYAFRKVSEGGLCRGFCGFQPTTTHDFPHPEARGRRQAVGRRSCRTPLVIGTVPRATDAIRVGAAAITVTRLRVTSGRLTHSPEGGDGPVGTPRQRRLYRTRRSPRHATRPTRIRLPWMFWRRGATAAPDPRSGRCLNHSWTRRGVPGSSDRPSRGGQERGSPTRCALQPGRVLERVRAGRQFRPQRTDRSLGVDPFSAPLSPALDETNRRQFKGCLADFIIDHLQINVLRVG